MLDLTPEPINGFVSELVPKRPSKLLGKKIRFYRSSALSFTPDTFTRVIAETSFTALLAGLDYDRYLALKALDRVERTGSKLQLKTRQQLQKMFAGARTSGGSEISLERLRGLPSGLSTPWRVLRWTFVAGIDRTQRRLFTRFAYYERLTVEFTRSRHLPAREERLRPLLEPSLKYWLGSGLSLHWEAIAVLDATLQHLVWLDRRYLREKPDRESSALLRLTYAGKRPMRHWFDQLLFSTGCVDLVDLHQMLVRKGAIRHRDVISHDLLKKWASTQRTLPYDAAEALLTGCFGAGAGNTRDADDLWFAKLLVFLAEFIYCLASEQVLISEAQSHIHRRIYLLHDEFEASEGTQNTKLFVF